MQEQIYTNYHLVLPTEEVLGTLVIRDGIITDIQPGIVSQGKNGEENYLLPGLIELHTDNLDKVHFSSSWSTMELRCSSN